MTYIQREETKKKAPIPKQCIKMTKRTELLMFFFELELLNLKRKPKTVQLV